MRASVSFSVPHRPAKPPSHGAEAPIQAGRFCGLIRNLPVVPQEHKSDTLGMRRRGIARSALIGGLAVVLAGCTATAQPGDRPTVSDSVTKSSVPGELMGQGTVLQRRPAEPVFCLGN